MISQNFHRDFIPSSLSPQNFAERCRMFIRCPGIPAKERNQPSDAEGSNKKTQAPY